MRRRHRLAALVIALVWLEPVGSTAVENVPTDPNERVAHHVREAEQIARYFEGVIQEDCPRFDSEREWKRYLNGEVDRVVLMMAHVEQAWVEAKRTHDKDVRRAAKAPRKHLEQTRAFVDKLEQCARDNGASFQPLVVYRKIEREIPKRQAEIALPLPQ